MTSASGRILPEAAAGAQAGNSGPRMRMDSELPVEAPNRSTGPDLLNALLWVGVKGLTDSEPLGARWAQEHASGRRTRAASRVSRRVTRR